MLRYRSCLSRWRRSNPRPTSRRTVRRLILCLSARKAYPHRLAKIIKPVLPPLGHFRPARPQPGEPLVATEERMVGGDGGVARLQRGAEYSAVYDFQRVFDDGDDWEPAGRAEMRCGFNVRNLRIKMHCHVWTAPPVKRFLRLRERLGCGHVFGLCVRERFAPAGPDEARLGSSPHHRIALAPAQTVHRASVPFAIVHITPSSPLDLSSPTAAKL
jgi:hypothetical protein